jgi:DNA-binding transcriptional MerR regulator/methylmalonyl-CoA mutase cobalamin-binding subunit
MSYRIKTLAKLTGISRNTITAWERRYGLLEPEHDASGYRVYTDADVDRLRRVKALLDEGYQIGEVVSMLQGAAVPPPAPTPTPGPTGLDEVRAALRDRLMAFDRTGTDEVHARLLEVSFRQRIDEVYMPLLRETGDAWVAGNASIAQEHFISAWVREQLVTMLKSLEQGPRSGPLVVCAGYPGEVHELGLLAVAVHMALRGHRLLYLGANLPADELVAMAKDRPAEIICQSVIYQRDPEELLAYAEDLRRRIDERVLIIFGGPGVATLEDHSMEGVLFCPNFDQLLDRWDQLQRRRLRRA